MSRVILGACLLVGTFLIGQLHANPLPKVIEYTVEFKHKTVTQSVLIEPHPLGYAIEYDSLDYRVNVVCDPQFFTLESRYIGKTSTTNVLAVRRGNLLVIDGVSKGEPIYNEYTINDDPWIQAFVYGFKPFVQSSSESLTFWMVRPGMFTVHPLVISKQSESPDSDDPIPSNWMSTKLTLPGWRAVFWHSYYWFDTSSGLMHRQQNAKSTTTISGMTY